MMASTSAAAECSVASSAPIGRRSRLSGFAAAAAAAAVAWLGPGAVAQAVEVRLCAPLATVVAAPAAPAGDKLLTADVAVPRDAPADLGVGAYVCDRDGHWFQRILPGALAPGRHRVEFPLGADELLTSEPNRALWLPDESQVSLRAGLFFYSASSSRATLAVDDLRVVADQPRGGAAPNVAIAHRLLETALDGMSGDGAAHIASGERWCLRAQPQPFPANPYDASEFSLDLVVTGPDGAQRRIAGFFQQPMAERDRGDREVLAPSGAGSFMVRFRPARAGHYALRLEARWRDGAVVAQALPDLVADGVSRQAYAAVDAADPRFFSLRSSGAADGAFWWPVGLNLHSPYDLRSRDALGTRLTPDRGSLVYDAMFDRLAAAGGDACEIWMSSWNVGLEWRSDWPGFQGMGRYNQGNAWKLDAILDHALARGIRVNLVINNHGQASANADREWKDNPWNSALGGPIDHPIDMFADPAALAGQERLRRYIIARYADHPAILGWKLWSEVDLTAARGEVAWRWHEQAAARWHALDGYRHPVTTHWAGDFRRVNPAVAVLPGIDYLCIDAYRHANANGAWRLLADILSDSTVYPGRGLAMYGKPILTTEFGAGSGASPEPCRLVDHLTGAWAALVSGHAGAPMLWWFEWVDQGERWQPFIAIRSFIGGEDLRGGRSAALDATPDDLWARCWVRQGRLLGYLLDRRWGADGSAHGEIAGATVTIGGQVGAGSLRLEWWNADSGELMSTREFYHPGGALALSAPTFARHIAFKLGRAESNDGAAGGTP